VTDARDGDGEGDGDDPPLVVVSRVNRIDPTRRIAISRRIDRMR
jgi:hypothetical protein